MNWTLLALSAFIAFQCILWAVSLRGAWFVLLAPGLVCAGKAWDIWRTIVPPPRG